MSHVGCIFTADGLFECAGSARRPALWGPETAEPGGAGEQQELGAPEAEAGPLQMTVAEQASVSERPYGAAPVFVPSDFPWASSATGSGTTATMFQTQTQEQQQSGTSIVPPVVVVTATYP